MRFAIGSSPHIATTETVSSVMRRVLYGMLPGIAALVWFFGWGVIINILIATAAALSFEAVMLLARGRPRGPFLTDYSVIVTAWLLGASLPPLAPWWLTVIGTGFAVIVAKHLYGGLGYNPFNPAMVGYVVLLISFPLEMSTWLPARGPGDYLLGPLETLNVILSGQLPLGLTFDAISGATPLDRVRTGLTLDRSIGAIMAEGPFGWLAGAGWEWVNLAFLAGGIWLIRTHTADWRIPAAMLGTLGGMA
ncbi:MAG: RnfABCDGE type electron transport complex subunit D, partial [Candidatus Competibacteraceae bacterium]|nr:RnfABCDGE type electron transport complex subunit D [Candidatus Competibacteraceae bacterium]